MRKHTSNQASTATSKIRPSLKVIEKPEPAEYPAYAHIYIDLLPDDGQILKHLEDNLKYTTYSQANKREVSSLLREFALVRQSTIAFFNSLDDAALLRTGVADGHRVSVRALVYHIAGHELRHMNIIEERYSS